MRIAKIHKFFMTLFAAIALAITPSISFATAPQDVENCLNTANSIQDAAQRDAALSACLTNAPFEMTFERVGTSMTTVEFTIAAKGTFYVFCGGAAAVHFGMRGSSSDVSVTEISMSAGRIGKTVQNTDDPITYQCVWAQNKSEVTIKIDGMATAYSANSTVASFSVQDSQSALNNKVNLAEIDGSLGVVFPTLGNCNNPTAQPRFYQSFAGCENMEGVIPKDLFTSGTNGNYTGVCGAPVSHMFDGTFKNAKNIVIPTTDGLFRGLSGAPAEYVFNETFYNAENSSNAVSAENNAVLPSNFFGSLSGSPAQYMFARTFHGCNKMKTEIPDGLFGNLSGTAATSMFDSTFKLCGNIYGSIPNRLFGTISGNATNMFNETFNECVNLGNQYGGPESAYYIPKSLFFNFNGTNVSSNMSNVFNNTKLMTSCPFGTQQWVPDPDFTTAWSSKVACEPAFVITIDGDSGDFMFGVAVRGDIIVDCGDDGTLEQVSSGTNYLSADYTTIELSSILAVTEKVFKCTYSNSLSNGNTRSISFGSANVTGYRSGSSATTIRFSDISGSVLTPNRLIGISGSLANVFPTIGNGGSGNQPSFEGTFKGCSNLTGKIPNGLFSGLTGTPSTSMFKDVFKECAKLYGKIPENLFGGVSGLTASLFNGTFYGCSSLGRDSLNGTPYNPEDGGGIPSSLLSVASGDLNGSVAQVFKQMFYNCSGLKGTIPATLFSNISGEVALEDFAGMFQGCSNLTGEIPIGLFDGILPNTGSYAEQVNTTGLGNFVGAMNNIFADTGLSETCECEAQKIVKSRNAPESPGETCSSSATPPCYPFAYFQDQWSNKAMCLTDIACETPCGFAQNLRVGAYSFALKKRDSNPITAEKTLNVKEPGVGGTETCYVPFSSTAPGIQGVLRIKVNGTTYYAEPAN